MRAQTLGTMPPTLPAMADGRSAPALSVGDRDPELAEVLDKGLDEYNFAATGTTEKDQGSFSVKVTGYRVWVSSFTFQAAGFYQKHGYAEADRTLGIPGGGEDVHMFKRL